MPSKSRKNANPVQPSSPAASHPTPEDVRQAAEKSTTTKKRVRKRRPPFVLWS